MSSPEGIVFTILLIKYVSLVWHRFFLPHLPTLVSIRNRLTSDEGHSTNSATNLLFALLSLISFEISESSSRLHPQLMRSIQLAVATFGQEFIFSPPTHRDSIVVSLLLSDYKPTALVSSQSVVHSAVKSELYINLAYRIAERLELLPTQSSLELGKLKAMAYFDLESSLIDSLQGLQIHCYDAFMEGYVANSLSTMRHVLSCMTTHVETYRNVLQCRQCSPRIIYHMQYAIGTYILMEALADMKQNWKNLESLSMIIEEAEKKCLDQIKSSNCILANSSDYREQDELSAVRSLLELKFHTVYASICASGLLYAMVQRARFEGGRIGGDPEVHWHEAILVGAQVIDSLKNTTSGKALSVSAFLNRFGSLYPRQLEAILERFIECTESLRLDGVAFYPPPRHLVLEIVSHCKNIVENNVIQLKGSSKLHPDFEKQLELFAECARRVETMVASPWNSIDAAFASGCVYAASSKLIHGLRDLMERLKTRKLQEKGEQEPSSVAEAPTDSNGFNELGLEFSSEGWELWPHVGGFDLFETFQDRSDWSLALNLFPGFESTDTSRYK